MTGNRDHMEENIGRQLRDYTSAPGGHSFEIIQRRLEKRRRRRFLYLLFFGTGIILLPLLSYLAISTEQTDRTVSVSTVSIVEHQKGEEGPKPVIGNPGSSEIPAFHSADRTRRKEKIPASAPVGELTRNPTGPKEENPGVRTVIDHAPIAIADAETSALAAIIKSRDTTTVVSVDSTRSEPNDPDPVVQSTLIAKSDTTSKPDVAELIPEKKPAVSRVLIGVFYTPQYSKLIFSGNHGVQGAVHEGYINDYLDHRRKNEKPHYNYAVGLKGGVILKRGWEIMAGFGYQRLIEEETEMPRAGGGGGGGGGITLAAATTSPQYFAFGNTKDGESVYSNRFTCFHSSLELCRLITTRRRLTFKFGGGLTVNRITNVKTVGLVSPDSYGDNTSARQRFMLVPSLKAGLIEPITPWLQLQVSPVVFFQANSMFRSEHIIRQRVFGAGLEIGLFAGFGR
jgi:hypothetical protein